ncbi:MAG: hypothetical protein JWN98_1178 [Abditibacteriota bacterium]|nr:hypothetical protein [Abditibacteriota bacterium]
MKRILKSCLPAPLRRIHLERKLSRHSQSAEFKSGGRVLAELIIASGVKPDDRVLEIGCGLGRVAIPLSEYLTQGTYDGIDILEGEIKWARRHISLGHPHFRFHHADLWNRYYNVYAQTRAADYRFPFADNAFDWIYLTSVFTHLLRADTEHYISEIARLLRPGGRCFATFFLITPERKAGDWIKRFPHEADGCRLHNAERPEWEVAFEEADIRTLFAQNNLVVDSIFQPSPNSQDVLLATKTSI